MRPPGYWHFASKTLRDGQPLPRKGQTLYHKGPVYPCESGYHASERAIDALYYAPGTMVARVRLGGIVIPHNQGDKYAAEMRTNLTEYVNAHNALIPLARKWALRALRIYAPKALRAIGLNEDAEKLEHLPDDCGLEDAIRIAMRAEEAADSIADCPRYTVRSAYTAARAAYDANIIFHTIRAVQRTAEEVCAAARGAHASITHATDTTYLTNGDREAGEAEKELQNEELEQELYKLLYE